VKNVQLKTTIATVLFRLNEPDVPIVTLVSIAVGGTTSGRVAAVNFLSHRHASSNTALHGVIAIVCSPNLLVVHRGRHVCVKVGRVTMTLRTGSGVRSSCAGNS